MNAFSWDSPTFGLAGHNVHEATAGSWVDDHHADGGHG
jgi:hypothetical protein